MFKKKLENPPKVMSMQEIQEDLETFSKTSIDINRSEIIADVSSSLGETKEELNQGTLSVSQFWDVLEVNRMQIEELMTSKEKLDEMKKDLIDHQKDLEQKKLALHTEIGENLERLRSMKTPKWAFLINLEAG